MIYLGENVSMASKSKEEGTDQDSIQTSTSTDTGNHMGKVTKHNKHHVQDNQKASPFQEVIHKAAENR